MHNLDARVRSSMGSEMIIFSSYSKKELREILNSRLSEAFKPDVVEEGVCDYCANVVDVMGSDARKAIDLLRVGGEIANEKKSNVTIPCVNEALERVEKDWEQEILDDLPYNSAVILGFISLLTLEKEKVSTRELYDAYKKARMEWRGRASRKEQKKLGERRVLDVVNDLETMGLINTWNISRGRKGYGKEIKTNMNPQSVLDFFKHKSTRFGFQLTSAS
jgi:cell division control protein 6